MFENILYFIIAILVYVTYQPPETLFLEPEHALALFFVLFFAFILLTRHTFSKHASAPGLSRQALDLKLANAVTRQSVMAVMFFAVDIYGLNLPAYLYKYSVFRYIPTLGTIFFFIVFLSYLVIVWALSHDIRVLIHGPGMTKKEYIRTNIMFALPVIIPWFLLSLIIDMIGIMPAGRLKPFMDSIPGQALLFILFLTAIASGGPWFVVHAWGCKPLPEGPDKRRIVSLGEKAGISFARILYWPVYGGRMITAGVMGIFKKFRYLLITPALFDLLSEDEIDAVIAHEIGHVRHRHMAFYFLFLAGYTLVSYTVLQLAALAIFFMQIAFFGPPPPGNAPNTFVFGICLVIVFIIYFRYVFGYFLRNFERQADLEVYPLVGSALPLISTFYKIASVSGQSPDRPNWHHFSINERIGFLKKCEEDKTHIQRHHKKVRVSVAAYLAVMAVLGVMCYQLNFGQTGQRLTSAVVKKALFFAAARNPATADSLVALADLYYSEKDYKMAIFAYKKALSRNPGNVHALNNLAWLYATCPEKEYRRPKEALNLAQRAAGLSEKPHILDTLAEALYANGLYGSAVSIETRAAGLATENKAYYAKQLEKFKKASSGRES